LHYHTHLLLSFHHRTQDTDNEKEEAVVESKHHHHAVTPLCIMEPGPLSSLSLSVAYALTRYSALSLCLLHQLALSLSLVPCCNTTMHHRA
jgi:hypothetical protein